MSEAELDGRVDWMLELTRARQVDLREVAIGELVEALLEAMLQALSAGGADLGRWGEWLGLGAHLALLRSRLLLPKDSPEARAAEAEAEALRRQLLDTAAMRRAAVWLDAQTVLGRDAFARGQPEADRAGRIGGDIVALMQACLVALRPLGSDEPYAPARPPLWRVIDAIALLSRILRVDPHGGELARFLPRVPVDGTAWELRCRAAVASTFLAGLELAREGTLNASQERGGPVFFAASGEGA